MSDFLGDDEEEEEEEDEDDPQSNDDDLEQFLDANSQPEPLPAPIPIAPVAVTPLTIPAAEPEVPAFDSSWTIEIFAGDIKRVEEVQIPESEWPVVVPKKVTEKVDKSGGNPLLKGLTTLFGGGAKKTDGNEVEVEVEAETQKTEQPESLPVVNDDQNVEDSIPVPAELSEDN
jgi:hypothetical protein